MKTDTWIPIISHLTDNGRFKEDEFQADIENCANSTATTATSTSR